MGLPRSAAGRSTLLSPGRRKPPRGAYRRQCLAPDVWHMNSSTSSWCGARPALLDYVEGEGLFMLESVGTGLGVHNEGGVMDNHISHSDGENTGSESSEASFIMALPD